MARIRTEALESSSELSGSRFFERRRWGVGFALVALIGALQLLSPLLSGDAPPARAPVGPSPLIFLVEIPLAMVAMSAAHHWASSRRLEWKTTLAVTALASIVVAYGCLVLLIVLVGPLSPDGPHYGVGLAASVGLGVVQAGIWVLAFVFPFAVEQARLRALEADRLRAMVELAHLRSQLEPHFLLNTLNAISGFVTQNPKEARRLLSNLGGLLTEALEGPKDVHTLDRELSWLRRYAAILESRYAGVIEFEWRVAPAAREALVPPLLLQPLVENAVKHGALARGGGGRVSVDISTTGAELVCTIEDNGTSAPTAFSGGFGLRSVRRRLELEYGRKGSLTLSSGATGTKAVVVLPLQVAQESAIEGCPQ